VGRRQWDHLRLADPVKIGAIVQQVAVRALSRTLAVLTAAECPCSCSGYPGRTGGNGAVEEAMDGVLASVSAAARSRRRSPAPSSRDVRTRSAFALTGAHRLDGSTNRATSLDQVAGVGQALTSILEPIMISVSGGIVGFIVISDVHSAVLGRTTRSTEPRAAAVRPRCLPPFSASLVAPKRPSATDSDPPVEHSSQPRRRRAQRRHPAQRPHVGLVRAGRARPLHRLQSGPAPRALVL